MSFYGIVGKPKSMEDWRFVWYWRMIRFGYLFTREGRSVLRLIHRHDREYKRELARRVADNGR